MTWQWGTCDTCQRSTRICVDVPGDNGMCFGCMGPGHGRKCQAPKRVDLSVATCGGKGYLLTECKEPTEGRVQGPFVRGVVTLKYLDVCGFHLTSQKWRELL